MADVGFLKELIAPTKIIGSKVLRAEFMTAAAVMSGEISVAEFIERDAEKPLPEEMLPRLDEVLNAVRGVMLDG